MTHCPVCQGTGFFLKKDETRRYFCRCKRGYEERMAWLRRFWSKAAEREPKTQKETPDGRLFLPL